MADEFKRTFPPVYSFEGRPSQDGSALLVEGTSFDGDIVRFAMPVDNIQHFIAFLLIWVGSISAHCPSGSDVESTEGSGRIPIPGNIDCDRTTQRR
jgi:hypothetical protein